jgi:hypothetical protein
MTLKEMFEQCAAWERATGKRAARGYVNHADVIGARDSLIGSPFPPPFTHGLTSVQMLDWYEDASVPVGSCRFEADDKAEASA